MTIEDEIKDEYADKARVLWDELRNTDFHDGRNKIAALLRKELHSKVKPITFVCKKCLALEWK